MIGNINKNIIFVLILKFVQNSVRFKMIKNFLIKTNIINCVEKILNSNRKVKFLIAFTIDFLVLYLSLLLAFFLRLGNFNFSLNLNDNVLVFQS